MQYAFIKLRCFCHVSVSSLNCLLGCYGYYCICFVAVCVRSVWHSVDSIYCLLGWFIVDSLSGESVELRYLLRSYGMPTEHIPISVTGTLKLGYVKQWMRAREVIEENYASDSNTETIVECPQLDDVLFRQGISLNSNPGNAMVRRLIISTYQKQEIAKVKRRKVVLNIIEEVRKTGGRFLVWNDEGWWNEILMDENEDLLMAKVEYIIKDVRRENRISVRQQQQLLKLNSSTSIFRNPVVSTVPLHSNISDEEDRSSSPSCGQDCLYRSALPTRRWRYEQNAEMNDDWYRTVS